MIRVFLIAASPLALKFVRGGATQEVNIVVGERPREGARGGE